jgi:hypothetical protein
MRSGWTGCARRGGEAAIARIHAPVGLDIGARRRPRSRCRSWRRSPSAAARLMRFGPVPLDQAEGAILAHSLMAGGRKLRKGAVLAADDIAPLAAAGVAQVTVARLDPGRRGRGSGRLPARRALVPDEAGPGWRARMPLPAGST